MADILMKSSSGRPGSHNPFYLPALWKYFAFYACWTRGRCLLVRCLMAAIGLALIAKL